MVIPRDWTLAVLTAVRRLRLNLPGQSISAQGTQSSPRSDSTTVERQRQLFPSSFCTKLRCRYRHRRERVNSGGGRLLLRAAYSVCSKNKQTIRWWPAAERCCRHGGADEESTLTSNGSSALYGHRTCAFLDSSYHPGLLYSCLFLRLQVLLMFLKHGNFNFKSESNGG